MNPRIITVLTGQMASVIADALKKEFRPFEFITKNINGLGWDIFCDIQEFGLTHGEYNEMIGFAKGFYKGRIGESP